MTGFAHALLFRRVEMFDDLGILRAFLAETFATGATVMPSSHQSEGLLTELAILHSFVGRPHGCDLDGHRRSESVDSIAELLGLFYGWRLHNKTLLRGEDLEALTLVPRNGSRFPIFERGERRVDHLTLRQEDLAVQLVARERFLCVQNFIAEQPEGEALWTFPAELSHFHRADLEPPRRPVQQVQRLIWIEN